MKELRYMTITTAVGELGSYQLYWSNTETEADVKRRVCVDTGETHVELFWGCITETPITTKFLNVIRSLYPSIEGNQLLKAAVNLYNAIMEDEDESA